MADEIKQVLGFDAVQALETLKQLDTALTSFGSKLNLLVGSMETFNAAAGRTNAALIQIKTNAQAAQAALSSVNLNGGSSRTTSQPSQNTGTKLTGEAAGEALDKLLGGGKEKLNTAKKATDDLFASINKIQGGATNAGTAVNQFGNNASNAFQRGQRSAAGFAVSMETIVRVITTQAIVRALSAIRDAMSTATKSAVDFERQIALIQTIAPGEKFEAIASGVRKISDNFNIPLLQAAEGVYQAVSNQVGNLGDSLEFTGQAAIFAKATNSSLADSVDLLSGALKSFDLDLSETQRVAGIFFTAIDKGRITATELANTFGRVGPSAKQVGINLEEFAGGIAAISIRGTKTNEALTQFRGIITGLTKPTVAMQNALRDMGFASVETAVATLRLDGLLDALAQRFGDNTKAAAALFPNVRGLGGQLSLTGENLKDFADDIRAGKNVTDDLISAKAALVFETNAEKVTGAINKIKNAFIQDFGQGALKAAANLLEFVGGADKAVSIVSKVIPVIATMATALATLALSLAAARLAAIAFTSSLGPLGLAIAAISAVPIIIKFIDDAKLANATKNIRELEKRNAERLLAESKASRESVKEFEDSNNKKTQVALKAVQSVNKTYLAQVEAAKAANKQIEADTERSFGRLVTQRERFIKAIGKALVDSRDQVRASLNRIADFQLEKSDLKFEGATQGLSDAQKAFASLQRSASLANLAAANFSKSFDVGDKEGQSRALSLFDKAQAELAKARSAAQAANNPALERQVFNEQIALLSRREELERRINQKQLERQKGLIAEKIAQEKIVAEMRKQVGIVLANTGSFDKDHKAFSPDELKTRNAARQDAEKAIADLSLNSNDFTVAKGLGLTNFIKGIQDDLATKPFDVNFNTEAAIKKLQDEIAGKELNLSVKFKFLDDLSKVLGRDLTANLGEDSLAKGIKEANAEATTLKKTLESAKLNETSIDLARGELDAIVKEIESHSADRSKLARTNGNDSQAASQIRGFNQLLSIIKEIQKEGGSATDEQVAAFKAIANATSDIGTTNKALESDFERLGRAANKVTVITDKTRNGPKVPDNAEERLGALLKVIDQFSQSNPLSSLSTNTGAAATNTGNMKTAIDNAVSPSATVAKNMQATATAAQAAAQASASIGSGGGGKGKALGGMIQGFNRGGIVDKMNYFAAGGQAKGTDTVPAMLTPGEFVVNAASTGKFFSQLQSINAGIEPTSRDSGGSSNVSIGDIIINETASARQTAREVVRHVKRELRRGTSKL